MIRPSLVSDAAGGPREAVQLAAAAVFAGLYLYQRRRRRAEGIGPAAA